jgi:D-alanyl-D-alanine carboxypeptidase
MAEFFDSWGGSPDSRISARGMAKMARALIREYPEVLGITSKSRVEFDETPYNNTNLLIGSYEGIDGFKTGFTNPAGWCLTATALRDGRRIISVTMGSARGYRFPDSVMLLDYGFDKYDLTIANYFRNAAMPLSSPYIPGNALVPIALYNIEAARYLRLRYIAIIMNELHN